LRQVLNEQENFWFLRVVSSPKINGAFESKRKSHPACDQECNEPGSTDARCRIADRSEFLVDADLHFSCRTLKSFGKSHDQHGLHLDESQFII